MGDMYALLVILIPTVLFILILALAIVLGLVRGFRKSVILAIQALVAFIACIILFVILSNNNNVDSNLVGIVNNFMGSGGLQRQLGVSESSTKVTEILYEFIPKQMDYGDGIALILRENGQYLLQLVMFAYKLILAIICFIIYLLLIFILYIIYLIFYPERRHKRKIEEKNTSLESETQYNKKRLFGGIIGLARGLVGGIVVMSFIGSFFYIAAGTGETKYSEKVSFDDASYNTGYEIYQAISSYGTGGIFKILNTIKVKDNMPFYLYAADLVFSGRLEDPNRGVSTSFNFANELGAYTDFSRKTVDLLMKYGKTELIETINSKGNVMDTILAIMKNPDFQTEFDLLIDDFDAKVFFTNFSLSLIDSIVDHIDQLKLAETNSDAVDTISLVFKKGYLSEYVPEEKEILDNLEANPDYQYEIQPYVTASKLLTKEDVKKLLKFVLSALDLDNNKDETEKILSMSEKILPHLEELSILDGNRKNEFNDIYERLYVYLDNRYLQPALLEQGASVTQNSSKVLLRGLDTEKLDWTAELQTLLKASSNIVSIAKNIYDKNNEVFLNMLNMFDESNANASSNEEKYDNTVSLIKYSKVLQRALSSANMQEFIKKQLANNFSDVYVPSVSYINTYDDAGNEKEGEIYNLLVGFKALIKDKDSRNALKDYKLMQDSSQSTKYVRNLLSIINTEKDGKKPVEIALNSILIRSVITGAISKYSTADFEIIIPSTVLETENDKKVNIIEKQELLNLVNNLLLVIPENGEIKNSTTLRTVLANKEALLESDVISVSVINLLANNENNNLKAVLIIPDDYKAESTLEKLKEYSDDNLWKTSNELYKLLDGLDDGFELSDPNLDLDNQEESKNIIKNNIKKLNDEIPGTGLTKLDKCYESKIIKASISNHMISEDVKGLVVPSDSYDDDDLYKYNGVDNKNIDKGEIKKLVDISILLNLDLENANIDSIILRTDDISELVKSKIFRATFDSKLKDNNQLVVPKDEDYTMNNGYVSQEELECFLTTISLNRGKLFGTTDENEPINVNVEINQNVFTLNEVESFMASNILHATIINKISSNATDYGIKMPAKLLEESDKTKLEDNFINSNWKNQSEMSNIINALKVMLGDNTLISDVKEDAIMDKVFDDSFDINKIYVSIVLNNTISDKLDSKLETLNRAVVMESTKEELSNIYTLNETDFPEVTYKSNEVNKLLKAIKNLGITSYNDLNDEFDYSKALLGDNVSVNTLYDSILFWDILTNKVKDQIEHNADIEDHENAYTNRGLSVDFYKQAEIESIRNVLKDSNTTDVSSFNAKNVKLDDTTKTAVNDSFIVRATVTKNLKNDANVITPSETYETDNRLLKVIDINSLIDALNLVGIDLSNTNIDTIILRRDDVPTLAASKIFRATFGNKLENNDKLVMPETSPTISNDYLAEQEMTNFLYVLCDNRKKIFNTEDEDTAISTNVEINQDAFSLGELKTFTVSNILHATIINKISSATSYGIEIPTKLMAEADKTELKANFGLDSFNWTAKNELDNILNSLATTFGDDTLLSAVNEAKIKEEILKDSFNISTFYTSIVLNYTISIKLSNKLNTLNTNEVTTYSKEGLSNKYSLASIDFSEVVYKEAEVSKLLTAIKALGFTSIDEIETADYADILLNKDDLNMTSLHNSILVWDIVTTKVHENIDSNPDIKDHNDAYETIDTLTRKFYKELEITSIKNVLKESGATTVSAFSVKNVKLNDTTKTAVDESFIVRATITNKLKNEPNILITSDVNETAELIYKDDINQLLDALNKVGIDLSNTDISSIILKKSDISTLVASKIFRATFGNKLDSNDKLVMPNTVPTLNNLGYLSDTEMTSFLTILCDNRSKIFNSSDENEKVSIEGVTINQDLFTLNELKGFITSNIMHATIINKISSATSYGINIPTKLSNEAVRDELKAGFGLDDFNWTAKNELENILDSLASAFGADTLISAVNETAIKNKIFADSFNISTFYTSIVLNYTISNKLDTSLSGLNNTNVIIYSKEKLSGKYTLNTSDFAEDVYKEAEVSKLIVGAKSLHITNLDNVSSSVNADILLNDDLNIDILYDSILLWDIVTIKVSDYISTDDPDTLKDHAKSKESRFSITGVEFYKKLELISLRNVLKQDSTVTSISAFGINNIVVNDTTKAAINDSYIVRGTLSNNICNNDSVKVPYSAYDFDDSLIKASEIISLLDSLEAAGLELHGLDVSSVKPSQIEDATSLTNSLILRASISNNVKGKDSTKLFTTECEFTTDYLNNNIYILTSAEIVSLVDAMKIFNPDSFEVELSVATIVNLSIENRYLVTKSNIFKLLISDMLLSGFTITGISGTLNYSTYVTTNSSITITGHDTYNLVQTSNPAIYKFKDSQIIENVYELHGSGTPVSKNILTQDDIVAFTQELSNRLGL